MDEAALFALRVAEVSKGQHPKVLANHRQESISNGGARRLIKAGGYRTVINLPGMTDNLPFDCETVDELAETGLSLLRIEFSDDF